MSVRKIAYNTLISAGARIVGLALSLITLGYITRYLGTSQFGQYSTVLAFLYLFVVFADLGLYSICVREISKPGADEKKIASNAFTIRLFFGLFVFALAPLIGLLFPYPGSVKTGILVGASGYWFLSSQQVLIGVFQKYLKMDRIALAEISSRIANLILVIVVIWKKLGFLYIIAAFCGGPAVSFIITFLFARKYILIKLSFDFAYWKKILKESLPLGFASILTMVYFKLDTVMLSIFKSQTDVGIYGLAYKILESLLFFPAVLVGVVMPLMSKHALADPAKFKKITQKTLDILIVLIAPLIAAVFCLAPRIILFISGPEYLQAAAVLDVLIIATGIIYIAVLLSNMIIAIEKQKTLIYIYSFGAVFNIIANLIFIPKYSYFGAAATTLATELLVTICMVIALWRVQKNIPSFGLVWKGALAASVMALAIFWLANLNLFIIIILASLVYFSALYLLGGFTFKDILLLIKNSSTSSP